MINVACVFKVLQSCGAGNGLPESLMSQDYSSSALSSCHEAFAVVRTLSKQQNNNTSAMHRWVCIIRDAQMGLQHFKEHNFNKLQ